MNLVGYSMGGGNVIGFASKYPKRVNKLILIAPAGYIPKYSGLASLVLIPGLGDWLMAMKGKQAMMEDIIDEVHKGKVPKSMVNNFEVQFKYKGYLRSILSTMRHYPMHDLSDEYEKVGKLGIPTYAIWGTEDMSVPFEGSEKVKQTIPDAKIYPVEGAGHSVTYAESETVNRILIDILGQ